MILSFWHGSFLGDMVVEIPRASSYWVILLLMTPQARQEHPGSDG